MMMRVRQSDDSGSGGFDFCLMMIPKLRCWWIECQSF